MSMSSRYLVKRCMRYVVDFELINLISPGMCKQQLWVFMHTHLVVTLVSILASCLTLDSESHDLCACHALVTLATVVLAG